MGMAGVQKTSLAGLHVAGLWRYPVKSLAGEPLSAAVIGPEGTPGDRSVRIRGPEGVRTSRRQYRLLGLLGSVTMSSDIDVASPARPPSIRHNTRALASQGRPEDLPKERGRCGEHDCAHGGTER